MLTGTSAANTISGGLGNDRIVGLAGNDTLNGNDGSDTFDGGTGNDKINGGTGVDIALYSGSTALVFDLSGTTDKVTQGSAVDTLTGVEGGSGSSGADTFRGDGANNYFRGGDGKDTATGGGGRDTYYYTSAQNSPATSGRDVITDFVHGQDKINLARIDPDSAHPATRLSTGWATRLGHHARRPFLVQLRRQHHRPGQHRHRQRGRVLDPAQRPCRAEPGGGGLRARQRRWSSCPRSVDGPS